MAITRIAGVAEGAVGAAPHTTTAIDTTGVDFLIGWFTYSSASTPGFSDNKGNTWTQLTARQSPFVAGRFLICHNPTVGTNHTFGWVNISGSTWGALVMVGFQNVKTTPASEGETGATSGSTTTIQTGSITPTAAPALIVAGLAFENPATASINSGFTVDAQVNMSNPDHFGAALAYLIQSPSAAVNPTWTLSAAGKAVAGIVAVHDTAATGSGPSAGAKRKYRRHNLLYLPDPLP